MSQPHTAAPPARDAGSAAPAKPFVIDVPSALGLRPDGVQEAPDALRRAGLHARLGAAEPLRIEVPPYRHLRDSHTGVLNPQAIAEVAGEVADAVADALSRGRLPIVLGGDCSILLGPMLALRRMGRHGLVFIDGHADFQHPDDEENGEVASLDLALVSGRGPRALADLQGLGPLVRDGDVALVGLRAHGDNDRFLDEQVADTAMTVLDWAEIRERGTRRALERIRSAVSRPGIEGFWVHFDVDVLDGELMPAVDYRVSGGLSWEQAREILSGVMAIPGARGLEITIFNPRLDNSGVLAARLADLVAESVLGAPGE